MQEADVATVIEGLPPAKRAPAAGTASQAVKQQGKGAAAARKAPAAPEGADRWAPRPKPDILTAEPAIGWKAARMVQRVRRQAIAAAKRGRPTTLKEGGSGAYFVARAADELAEHRRRETCPIEQAALALRRRRVVVYRMSVLDGDPALWFVAGLGRDVTGEQLVAHARKLTK